MDTRFYVLTDVELEAIIGRVFARLSDTFHPQNADINEQPKMQEVYTMAEAAKALKICTATLYTLIKSGSIKSVKVGRKRMITEKSIQTFLHPKK